MGREESETVRLLTGATDGIGAELALRWRDRPGTSHLAGRRPLEDLDAALFTPATYLRADLADPGAPEELARELARRGVDALDLVVLNAGVGWVGPIAAQTPESIRELVEVDLVAPLRLCHLLLPALRRARGRVVFVSSVVSALPCPEYAVYAAAKAAAEGFFRSLRVEVDGEVEVQVLRPGAVKTAMHRKSGADPASIGWERFPSPADVARRIDDALAGPPVWRTLGGANRLVAGVGRNLPGLVDRVRARSAT
jgi:short-subunit dehydrogenase